MPLAASEGQRGFPRVTDRGGTTATVRECHGRVSVPAREGELACGRESAALRTAPHVSPSLI